MISESGLFLFGVVMSAVLLFAMVFFIIMYSDLECDYINPIDLCSKLNAYVIPEAAAHAFLTLLFLVCGSWLALAINLPLALYNAKKMVARKHQFDPTTIFRTLPAHKREGLIKLGFYLLCFFYYLYRMIVALINSQ
ncbi:hypothetical protein AMAG_09567 [Allomyces macrogynus ATCC 38327]|uniref:ER-derived vesicles protein ERV14 n=1 Tax=Allomyces macrogynus (strain ATCC 38327) TaxID=578462 RepID=A0A0L0SSU8_ALLM3|nr:hypothetical protein GGF32_006824 [Allomyces javanicus]KAJ3374402.1 hypothetical protein GGF31_007922 [Allomyces arbusculus]KNE65587.1 hypothetical protein AMAG_09567 [Allomyces macrogynus ATCC 38327]|eukprot:KNE65587.1 hypothetical protein AMAG_09567 [Allomyces macrogynus ATCC 38327]